MLLRAPAWHGSCSCGACIHLHIRAVRRRSCAAPRATASHPHQAQPQQRGAERHHSGRAASSALQSRERFSAPQTNAAQRQGRAAPVAPGAQRQQAPARSLTTSAAALEPDRDDDNDNDTEDPALSVGENADEDPSGHLEDTVASASEDDIEDTSGYLEVDFGADEASAKRTAAYAASETAAAAATGAQGAAQDDGDAAPVPADARIGEPPPDWPTFVDDWAVQGEMYVIVAAEEAAKAEACALQSFVVLFVEPGKVGASVAGEEVA